MDMGCSPYREKQNGKDPIKIRPKHVEISTMVVWIINIRVGQREERKNQRCKQLYK